MLRAGHMLQLIVLALLGLGVVMIHSAGMTIGRGNMADPLSLVQTRMLIYAGLAIVAMLIASRLDVRYLFHSRIWFRPLWLLVIIALGCTALTLVPGMGKSVNGASRWLHLGPMGIGLSFQPSEIVKLAMVLAIASWCAHRAGMMRRFVDGLLPPLLLLGMACGLIIIEDLGTAVLIGGVAVIVLIAGGARLWQVLLLTLPALGGLYFAIAHSPYRLARLMAFADPWADPRGTGYHPIQSMIAIAMGGPAGRGLGNGIQKFGYLPEDTTDFIFAVICEELGIAGAALVVVLYLALIWTGFNVARACRDTFGRLLAIGVVLTIGLQALMNLMVVTVMVPTKGIALPLISAGGTGWIITAFGLGLVAALDNANHMQPATDEPQLAWELKVES